MLTTPALWALMNHYSQQVPCFILKTSEAQSNKVNPIHQLGTGTLPQMFGDLCLCANKAFNSYCSNKWLSSLHCEILIVLLENVCSIYIFYW